MTRFVAIGFALLLSASVYAQEAESKIPWHDDYGSAMAQADKEGKPVLIDFVAEWCGWCKRMDVETYSDANVAEGLSDYVCVKVDTDKNPHIALAYQVRALPRTMIVNVHDEIVADRSGYMPADDFLKFLKDTAPNLERETGWTKTPEITDSVEERRKAFQASLEAKAEEGPAELVAMLAEQDPLRRARVQERIVALGDDALPALVDALNGDYLGLRIAALETLRKMGHDEIGFDPWAPADARAKAHERLQARLGQR